MLYQATEGNCHVRAQKRWCARSSSSHHPVRLAYQSPVSSTFPSEQTSHQQPANSIFLSEQIRTSHLHQPNEQTVSKASN
jgi:hypothetical protein